MKAVQRFAVIVAVALLATNAIAGYGGMGTSAEWGDDGSAVSGSAFKALSIYLGCGALAGYLWAKIANAKHEDKYDPIGCAILGGMAAFFAAPVFIYIIYS